MTTEETCPSWCWLAEPHPGRPHQRMPEGRGGCLPAAEAWVTTLMMVTAAVGLFLVAISSDVEDVTRAGFSTLGVLLMAVVIQLAKRSEP